MDELEKSLNKSHTDERWAELVRALLATLGRASAQEHLQAALGQCGLDTDRLLLSTSQEHSKARPETALAAGLPEAATASKAPSASAYAIDWPQAGLSLLMQPLPAQQGLSVTSSWGLHAISFEASQWLGPWPGQLQPQSATAQDIIDLFAPGSQDALALPQMACCTTAGPDAQSWSVVALFDPASRKLQHLTFTRAGDWMGVSILSPWAQEV